MHITKFGIHVIVAMILVFALALYWHIIVGWTVAIIGSLLPLGVIAAVLIWERDDV